MKKQWYFSQNQKGFGCIGAAVSLILSPKELIWQKRGSQLWLSLPRSCSKLWWLRNTGISGCDSQSWLPRFCHISFLEDKISNTDASMQPNPFWFWEKYQRFLIYFLWIVCILACEGPKEQVCEGNCSQWPQLYPSYEATYDYDLKYKHKTSYLLKTIFPQNHTSNLCILFLEASRE